MKKIILISIFYILTILPFVAMAEDADEKLVAAFLVQEKIERESVTILDTSWGEICSSSIVDDPSNTKLSFRLSVKKKITYRGNVFEPSTDLRFCDNSLIQVDAVNDRTHKEFVVQGFTCLTGYSLTKKGNLCRCRLSKATVVEGVLLPKDTIISLSKNKVVKVDLKEKDSRVEPSTLYTIKNKKLIPLSREIKSCNYEE